MEQKLTNTATGEKDKYPVKTDGKPENTKPAFRVGSVDLAGKMSAPTFKGEFSYSEALTGSSVYDKEGPAPTNIGDVYKNRIVQQSEFMKGINAIVGGAVSGVGTMIEGVGDLLDVNTYRAMFGDVEWKATQGLGEYNNVADYASAPGRVVSEIGTQLKNLSEKVMPIYEEAPKEGDVLSQVWNWNSLKGIVDSAIGFVGIGGAAAKGVTMATKGLIKGLTATGKVARAAKIANAGRKTLLYNNWITSGLSKLARTEQYTMALAEANPAIIENLGAVASSILSKGAEARIEGYDAYQTALYKNQRLVDAGILTPEEAEEAANRAGNYAYDMTMWTAALDVGMLKGFFKGKIGRVQKMSKPSRLSHYGKMTLGAPREGFEEMWQAGAQQEGYMQGLYYVQNKLEQDGDLKRLRDIKSITGNEPKNWADRTLNYMLSAEGLSAAIIGAVSGPLQNIGVARLQGDTYRKALEDYEKNKELFAENEQLFGSANVFAEKVKETIQQEDLLNYSAMIDDTENGEISLLAEEIVARRLAKEAINKGTSGDLADTFRNNKRKDLEKVVRDVEKDYAKHMSYYNTDQLVTMSQTIAGLTKTRDMFKKLAEDTTITDNKRKQFAEQANEIEKDIVDFQQAYDELKSQKHQDLLFEAEQKKTEFVTKLTKANSENDISSLEEMRKQYENEPAAVKLIDEKIADIKEEARKKKEKKKKGIVKRVKNKVNKKSKTEYTKNKKGVEVLTKESVNDFVDKNADTIFDDLGLKNTKELKQQAKELINKRLEETPIDVSVEDILKTFAEEQANKQGTAEKTKSNKEVQSEKEQQSEDNKKTTLKDGETVNENGTPQMNFEAAKALASNVLTTAMVESGIDSTTLTDKDIEYLAKEIQKDNPAVVDIPAYINETLVQKANQYVQEKFPGGKPENIEVNKNTGKYSELTKKAANDFINVLIGDKIVKESSTETVDTAAAEFPAPNEQKQQALRETMNNLVSSLIAEGKVNLSNPNDAFTSVLDAISDLYENDGIESIIKEWFPTIKGTFMAVTNTEPTITIDDYFKPEPTPLTPEGMPTDENNEQIVKVPVKYISSIQTSEELTEAYTQSDKIPVGNKNKQPALSLAYLSQEWMLEMDEEGNYRRTDADKNVKTQPLLNPYEFNPGTKIILAVDKNYDGKTRLSNGKVVEWKELEKDAKSLSVKDWREKYGLENTDETIEDYVPIQVLHNGNKIAYMHVTGWINEVNAAEGIIEENRKLMRKMRKQILSSKEPIETEIAEKVMEFDENSLHYIGFVPNVDETKQRTSNALPGEDTQVLGAKDLNKVKGNILNLPVTDYFKANTTFVVVPIGEKNGIMQYHAEPLYLRKFNGSLAEGLATALEIFLTQDPTVNQELFNYYQKNGINLLNRKQVSDLLSSVAFTYNPKSTGQDLSDFMRARVEEGKTNDGFIEFQGNTIRFGSTDVLSKWEKNKKPAEINELRKKLRNTINKMYINPNFNKLKSDDSFSFVGVNQGKLDTFTGNYSDFIKRNTDTQLRSTDLGNGVHAYTKQNIITFKDFSETTVEDAITEEQVRQMKDLGYSQAEIDNMTTEEVVDIINNKKKNKTEKKEQPITETKTDERNSRLEEINSNERAMKLLSIAQEINPGMTVEGLFAAFLNGNKTLEENINHVKKAYIAVANLKGSTDTSIITKLNNC